ncbi:hypothetical protein [Erythrobacter aureus]|uniref:Uncharacterized protein n=1 Tax=Erythrobacter aureus TaxID=2182384 RepID=A0A345YIX2_9SPHN|nr:hypothetical protein [Erythrobacter aureus]AXK43874.1 hypothetical protein DVR09_15580 [Erythrobacter aureus]
MANAARRFSPTFVATVTPESVDTRTGKNGPYAVLKGAQVSTANGEPMTRTVMAFGRSHDLVEGKLHAGQPVDLAVRYDGGTLRVVGLPAENDDEPQAAPAQKADPMLSACLASAGFDEHRDYGVA